MTYIPQSRIRYGEVVRLVSTRDERGHVIDESYTTVYASHALDLQPLSYQERLAADQLKIKVTHKVFPQRNIVPQVSLNDFYRIAGQYYRIVEKKDFLRVGYFRVWEGEFGAPPTTPSIIRTVYSYVVHGLGPGSYTFGSGALADVPEFESTPLVLDTLTNDGGYYMTNYSATGFTIVDKGTGLAPIVSVFIQGIPAS